jgi:hypothetical protein
MDHYRGRDSALNEQVLWHIRGHCDVEALRRAMDQLSARHESLRTTFVARKRQLIQIVHDAEPVPLRLVDVSGQPQPRQAARDVIAGEVLTPIDAAQSPVRATLITVGPEHHVFALTMHHYVSDDWSNALLSRDIRALYAGEDLPPVQWQYPDWSGWHHDLLDGAERERLSNYWRDHLAGARLPQLPEQATVPRSADEPGWISVELPISPEATAGLRKLAREQRTTLFPVMLSLFYLVLHQMTGQSDLAVASLFANRGRPEVRDTVGFFITMVLLRCRLNEGEPFSEVVRRARAAVMEGMRHQELPLQLLPPGTIDGPGRTDDVMFQLLGSFMTRADMEGEELDDLEAQLERRRFALEFVVVPQGEGLTALLLCSRDRFDPEWAERCVRDYVALAQAVVADSGAFVAAAR